MEKKEIFSIALKYVMELARKKPYNLQTIAVNRNFNYNLLNDYEAFNLNYNDFLKEYPKKKVQDNVLKNDGLSFRNMHLISPYHYLYYNYQVFLLYYYLNKNNTNLSLLKYPNQSVFYAGKIELNKKNIAENSVFNKQYSDFIEDRHELKYAKKIVSLDLKSFFDSIDINLLIIKLSELVGKDTMALNVVKNINSFFKKNKFHSLPQLHYSIASSYLSQLFLDDSSISFSNLLQKNNSYAVRYVDDVFIGFFGQDTEKVINNFIKTTSDILWQDGLVLNMNKVKVFTPDNFISYVDTISISIDQDNNFIRYSAINKNSSNRIETKIFNKVESLTTNNAKQLVNFFRETQKLYKNEGYDFREFNRLLKDYISIDGDDVSKVLNTLMFNKNINISRKAKLEILDLVEGVRFYPEILTQLYILLSKDIQDNNYKNKLYNTLLKEQRFSHREMIVAKNYLVQYKNNRSLVTSQNSLIRKSKNYNSSYTDFVFNFCI